jgi:hypothetical protein
MTRVKKQNLVAAVTAILFFILLFIFFKPPETFQSSKLEKTSTFYTDESGSRAVFLVLNSFLPSVERWMKPLDFLPPPEEKNPTSLLIMGPCISIEEAEADSLDSWVAQGGQLIIADRKPWTCIRGEDEDGEEVKSDGIPFRPDDYHSHHGFTFTDDKHAPGEYADSTGRLLLEGSVLHQGDFNVLFSGKTGIKGAEKRIGRGRIIVITDSLAWSNERLSQSGNAAWLVSTILSWGNGRLLIDEFHHGFQKTRGIFSFLLSFFASFWGLAFLQLAAAGLLLLYARAKRFGNVMVLLPEKREDPQERIKALGALLEAAGAKSFAIRTIHQLLLKRLWQFRYGPIREKGQSSIEKNLLNPKLLQGDISRYLSLVQKAEGGGALTKEEFVLAARKSGEITKEYRYAGKRNK